MKIELGRSDTGAVHLDLDVLVPSKLLVQATSGGGKSWTVRRLLEQSHGKIQHIVLDPEGEFPSLRERFDYVLVGKGGDVAADVRYAETLVRRLMELHASAIIDIYELRQPDRHHFVKVFLEALVNIPKDLWGPLLVVVDEAHVYCPEKGYGESEATTSVVDLCTRGRKRGFCAALATQGIAALNKAATSMLRNRLVGLTVEDVHRKRAAHELGRKGDDQFELSLRDLDPGDFYCFGPAISKQIVQARIGPVLTSHPEIGKKVRAAAPPPPPEKVRAILQKLADIPKEAEDERSEVERLRGEVATLRRKAAEVLKPEVRLERVEVQVVPEGLPEVLQSLRGTLGALREAVDERFGAIASAAESAAAAAKEQIGIVVVDVDRLSRVLAAAQARSQIVASTNATEPPAKWHGDHGARVTLAPRPTFIDKHAGRVKPPVNEGKHEQKVLTALLRFERLGLRAMDYRYVCGLARVSPTSSTTKAAFKALRDGGLIEERAEGWSLTESGVKEAGRWYDSRWEAANQVELVDAFRSLLNSYEASLFDALASKHGRRISLEQLSAETGKSTTSSTFKAAVKKLRDLGIAVTEGDAIRADDRLFAFAGTR